MISLKDAKRLHGKVWVVDNDTTPKSYFLPEPPAWFFENDDGDEYDAEEYGPWKPPTMSRAIELYRFDDNPKSGSLWLWSKRYTRDMDQMICVDRRWVFKTRKECLKRCAQIVRYQQQIDRMLERARKAQERLDDWMA